MWRKKVALAIKEKARKQNMVRSKCLNNFFPKYLEILLVVHCMKIVWVKYVTVYFILLSSLTMNYSVLHPLVNKYQKWYPVSE